MTSAYWTDKRWIKQPKANKFTECPQREMAALDLFSSVRDGNTDIVRRLLQSKQCRARLNDRNEWGDTALHLAAEAGNGEICHMLIAAGASVTVRNNRGETCLHRAAVGGHVESVSAIVGKMGERERKRGGEGEGGREGGRERTRGDKLGSFWDTIVALYCLDDFCFHKQFICHHITKTHTPHFQYYITFFTN